MSAQTSVVQRERNRLYTPSWECIVCMNDLGVEPGMIPAVITTCRPVAHMICMKCADKLKADSGGKPHCPSCRKECGDIVPIAALVSEQADPAAARILDSVRYVAESAFNLAQSKSLVALTARAASNSKLEIIQKRVDYVIAEVNKKLNDPKITTKYPNGFTCWSWEVPKFDETNVRLVCKSTQLHPRRQQRAQVALQLSEMVKELQPFVNAVFEGSGISVTFTEDQSYNGKGKKFAYLMMAINQSGLKQKFAPPRNDARLKEMERMLQMSPPQYEWPSGRLINRPELTPPVSSSNIPAPVLPPQLPPLSPPQRSSTTNNFKEKNEESDEDDGDKDDDDSDDFGDNDDDSDSSKGDDNSDSENDEEEDDDDDEDYEADVKQKRRKILKLLLKRRKKLAKKKKVEDVTEAALKLIL